MRGSNSGVRRVQVERIILVCAVVVAMLGASLASVSVGAQTAEARGPAYGGPQTESPGPAYFGPAPNPFPYCDSPTYFDPFPENISPIGRMDVGDTASVTTDGITMNLEITAEGNPGTQYPGFFPGGGDGSPTDQAKGIELAEGDGARVTLTEPLFYSQWIFTDVDQPNEGFTVTPQWTEVGQAAVFGGDNQFTFAGTTATSVELDDIDGSSQASESIEGRVQVDFLGAVQGIDMLRTDPSNGQSGFAVGGGCEAAGAAKVVVEGPTWNGSSYDVVYDLRVRNNLPSSDTIQSVIDDAVAAVGASFVTSTPQGIDLTILELTDDLTDPGFSEIVVTDLTTDGNLTLNPNYDGIADTNLISSGAIDAESDAVLRLSVQYTPNLENPDWGDCSTGYTYSNQSTVTGTAAGVPISDVSDDGTSAAPSDDNGAGGVDDPTLVVFDCPPGDLQIVKTVLPGPGATCPAFADGIQGDGPALAVTSGDFVTYCISILNAGIGPIFDATITDPQAPGSFPAQDLAGGATHTVSFDLQVNESTPTVNTATASGSDVNGPLDPVSDTALIAVSPKPLPELEIVKTVLAGANTPCPAFDAGVAGLGPALDVLDGDQVTYCISVRNVGSGAANDVVISDPQAPSDFAIGMLLSGEGDTVSYNLTVSTDTAPVNVATGNYSGPDGPLEPVSDDAQITVSPLEPQLQIVKTVLPGESASCPSFDGGEPGLGAALVVDDRDSVTYCITVRNSGDGIATDVVVTDPQAPAPGTFSIGTLGSGEEETVSFTIAVALGTTPPVNTAVASGNGPTGPLDEVSDQAQISIDALPDPGLQIVKTALPGPGATCPSFDGGTLGAGTPVEFLETETVTYCISVRNTGPGPATNVVLADDQAPGTVDLVIGDLAVDQEVTRSYDVANLMVGDPTENVAIATGSGLNGPLEPVSDPALIAISLQPDPILEIVKTVVAGGTPNANCPQSFDEGVLGFGNTLAVLEGDTVTYCITVRNVGDNDATSVQVADDQAPGTLQIGLLPAGEERSAQYEVLVDAATPLENIATVSGIGPNGAVDPASDPARIATSPQPDPVLEIVKSVVAGPNGDCPTEFDQTLLGDGEALSFATGDTVTYCIVVRNVSGTTANDVTVTDDQAPGPIALGTIEVGGLATAQYDVAVDQTSPLQNTASVIGQGPNGPTNPVTDTAVITPLPDPVLEIVKTVVAPGDDCPADFESGVDGQGAPLDVDLDAFAKYCVTVKNTGDGIATDVTITDDQAPQNFDIGVLNPGQETSVEYNVQIGLTTDLLNTAVVTGTGPHSGPGEITDSDTAVVALIDTRVAAISLIHSVTKTDECITEAKNLNSLAADRELLSITWCVKVTNTGNVHLADIVLEAPDIADGDIVVLAENGGDVLAPLESAFIFIDGVIPDTGLISRAGVEGVPSDADGTPLAGLDNPSDSDNATVLEASISIVSTVIPGADADCSDAGEVATVKPGDEVTWCYTVTNTGSTVLAVDEVTDDVLGVSIAVPEEFQTFAINDTFVVQVTTVAEGPLVNNGDVAGQPLGFDEEPLEAPEVVDNDDAQIIVPTADVSIIKTNSNNGPVSAPTVLTYTLEVSNAGPDAALDVSVVDSLPAGLVYDSIPAADGWVCARDGDDRGFTCLKSEPLEAGDTETLTYQVTAVGGPGAYGVDLVNTVTVTSSTPDPDETNNTSDSPTSVDEPPLGVTQEPDPDRLDYPGPFTQPEPEEAPAPPDEVLGLVVTGAASNLLTMVAAAMLALGGTFMVGARRSREEDDV